MTKPPRSNIQSNDRDAGLLRWINGHGSVTLQQIARWGGTSYQSAQRRVRQLVEHGYLERRYLVHGDRTHWLTKKGQQICGDDLPPPKDIKLGSYRHDHILVDLSLSLIAETGGRFTPERRLRQAAGLNRVGERYHVADGWLRLDFLDHPVVIELELSTKGTERSQKMTTTYCFQTVLGRSCFWPATAASRKPYVSPVS